MAIPESDQSLSEEPVQLVFDPDAVDWFKYRIVKALKVLNCFDEDNWPKALHLRIDRIKDPKKIASILLARFGVPDELRKTWLNEHPLRLFQFIARVLENAVYDELLVWRVKTLFPELAALNKPLVALDMTDPESFGSIDSLTKLNEALASDELREKLYNIFHDPPTQFRVNQFVNSYCHKAVEYVLPKVSQRVNDFLVTLFVEAGTDQAKQVFGLPDSKLRAFLKRARQQTIEVVKEDLTDRYGIRRGASKEAKQSKIQVPKGFLETVLPRKIRERWEQGLSTERGVIARALGFTNAKALDRLRKNVLKDNRSWKQVVADATKK